MKPILTSIIYAAEQPAATPALYRYDGKEWTPISRPDMWAAVRHAAAGLHLLGLDVQQSLGIYSENRPEVVMSVFAAFALRSVVVPLYATASADQVKFIASDAGIRHIVVGSQHHYDVARRVGIPHIIAIDPAITVQPDDTTTVTFDRLVQTGAEAADEVKNRVRQCATESSESDTATIIYTSGTTGEPKGAVLPHSSFNFCFDAHVKFLPWITSDDTSICFLPLSHIFELAWTCFCLWRGISVYVNQDPARVQQALRETHPTCMCCVPRFWEKVYTVVQDKIKKMSPVNKLMVKMALSTGRERNLRCINEGRTPSAWLERRYRFFDKMIFHKLRRVIGVERGRMFPTAGAPIAPEIVEFCQAVGINVYVGYGLSETTATVTCFPRHGFRIGSVGTPLPGIDVSISHEGEVLVKGPTVMKCYFNRPEATAQAFTSDGWFRTGDGGRLDADGTLWLTDRIKDLFKTSNGKYIAPQMLESRLATDGFIEQAAVIGDNRKFVTALIVPQRQAVEEFAAKQKLHYAAYEELLSNDRVVEMMTDRIARLQQDVAPYEQIKRFTLLPKPFTMDTSELTNTLKLRRPVINKRYAAEIDKMYE